MFSCNCKWVACVRMFVECMPYTHIPVNAVLRSISLLCDAPLLFRPLVIFHLAQAQPNRWLSTKVSPNKYRSIVPFRSPNLCHRFRSIKSDLIIIYTKVQEVWIIIPFAWTSIIIVNQEKENEDIFMNTYIESNHRPPTMPSIQPFSNASRYPI